MIMVLVFAALFSIGAASFDKPEEVILTDKIEEVE